MPGDHLSQSQRPRSGRARVLPRRLNGPEIAAFRTVARVLSEPSLLVERSGRIVACNPAAQQLFGPGPVEGLYLDGLLCSRRQDPGDWLRLASGSTQLIPGRFCRVGSGQSIFMEAAALSEGTRRGFVFVRVRRYDTLMHRIVSLEEDRRTLRTRSERDSLTGLPNRAGFDQRWRELWSAPASRLTRVGLVLLDVDDFKAYNDYYGHAAGDECLQRVARQIAQVSNERGLFAARIGGEELAVVAEDRTLADLGAAAQQIVTEVSELGIPHESVHMIGRVTISAGVSVAERETTTPDRLREAADQALYRAKFLGKNRVEVRRAG